MNLKTVDEIASIFKVSAYTVRRWARDGVVPARKINGGQWLFDADEVQRALEVNTDGESTARADK